MTGKRNRFALPEGFDWPEWVERWERMQERYVPAREGGSSGNIDRGHSV